MMENWKITDSICLIDANVFGIPNFTSAYLVVGKELALIETGPTKSAHLITEGIRGFGFDPADLSYLIVTHVHMDHAGGAGTLIKEMPMAKVVVHQKGARHMVDPSRLVSSSKRVFGNLVDEWYGETLPVPQDRIIPAKEGEMIDLGKGQRLRVIDSPGHATHHICIYSERDGALFTGDAAGIYLPHSGAVIPTTPPPEFDPEVNVKTIKGLMDLDPDLLLFSHFGHVDKPYQTLNRSISWLMKWRDTVSEMMRGDDASMEKVTQKFREDTKEALAPNKPTESVYRWIMEHHIPMCASGYLNYFKKKAS